MKQILTSIGLTLSVVGYSQVSIGKNSLTNSDVSLEFADTENRGLILPWVTSESDIVNGVDGTVIFDTSDSKVKVLNAGVWQTLIVDSPDLPTGIVDTSLQKTKDEIASAKVVIGQTIDPDVDGVLVLSDKNKAMILPKVASPHLNIINPAPGMIVYDTAAHQVAVFNGQAWSFWAGL
ncbi:hypothetical protein [Epilithonimonas caeni]|uniref:hypothetical protein n=1 Tax=Epilithonimonas caeni TaxID=365343 RepID=UPI00047F4204|nr:hypothetical protein [Epilithonimonas caeni]